VRVVILGQDPYFNPGQATGVAFSVGAGCTKFPPTLRNIIKEVRAEMGICTVEDGDLTPWVRQGVLLLNTCLTVREGTAFSHADIGWGGFIQHTIEVLNKKNNIVFVLWGNNAKKFMPMLTNKNNLVLTSSHPSPLSAHAGFFGCGHFRKINQFLVSKGSKAITF
jgi:uracil-DNA glycosylase